MDGKPSTDEQIGFHKGALSTLAKEREELSRMVGMVEQLMHMHVKALQNLGANLGKGESQKPRKEQEKK